MQIEIATTDSFKDVRDGAFVDALADSDFTAKLELKGLPADRRLPAPSTCTGTITRRPRSSSARAPTVLCENICR
jgi:hypothetical protein